MFIHFVNESRHSLAFNPHTMAVADLDDSEARSFAEIVSGNPAADLSLAAILRANGCSQPDSLHEKLRKERFFDSAATLVEQNSVERRTAELVLNVAQACNLKCSYCFSNNSVKEYMDEDTAIRAIDDTIAREDSIRKFRLSFFGGEPTLNFSLIRKIVRYHHDLCAQRGVEVEYFLITNAVSVSDEMLSFFGDYEFEVQVSIDGDQGSHDAFRLDNRGRGTYARVVDTIGRLLATPGIRLSTSSVITGSSSARATYDVLEPLKLLNMKIDPAHDFDADGPSAQDAAVRSSGLEQDLEYLGGRFAEKVISWERPSEYNLTQGVLLLWQKRTKTRFCPAGSVRLGVGADGSYFPCGASASLGENVLGHVNTGLDIQAVRDFDAKLDVQSREPCRSCWAQPLCLGGCPLKVRRSHPTPAHCAARRATAETVIRTYAKIRRDNPLGFVVLVDNSFGRQLGEAIEAIGGLASLETS